MIAVTEIANLFTGRSPGNATHGDVETTGNQVCLQIAPTGAHEHRSNAQLFGQVNCPINVESRQLCIFELTERRVIATDTNPQQAGCDDAVERRTRGPRHAANNNLLYFCGTIQQVELREDTATKAIEFLTQLHEVRSCCSRPCRASSARSTL